MPLDWNHVYTGVDGIDWQDVALINMYISALTERNFFVTAPLALRVAGDDIQDNALWRRLQENFDGGGFFEPTTGGLFANGYPSDDDPITGYWVEDVDFTGDPQSDLYPFVGAPRVIDWPHVKTAVLGGKSWTRKHPREFFSVSSTAYYWTDTIRDPNAFADGHYARQRDTGLVYHRVSGAWVLALGVDPDIVVTDGPIQAGDYLGYWILNELRDAIDLLMAAVLIERHGYVDSEGRQSQFGGGYNGDFPTWTDAKNDAETHYAASSDGYYTAPGFQTAGLNHDPDYAAGLTRSRARAKASCWNSTTNCSVDFYDMGFPNPASGTFDNTGDPINLGTWTKWDTKSVPAGSAAVASAYLGDLSVPAWVSSPSLPYGTQAFNGYIATANGFTGDEFGGNNDYGHSYYIQRIVRFNVAGGFVYKP